MYKKEPLMKSKFLPVLATAIVLASCAKEVSLENGGVGNLNIVGNDCRISSIVFRDPAAGIGLGSVTAIINTADKLADLTDFDSATFTINKNVVPVYSNDTLYINPNEYFVLSPGTLRVKRLHSLLDPTNPGSPQIDVDYTYNAVGYLAQKSFSLTATGTPYAEVNYTYIGANLTRMEEIDLVAGVTVNDADIQYTSLQPKNFLYIFPDEFDQPIFNQFLNFGARPVNAVAKITNRFYDFTTGTVDSTVSSFGNYELSADKYVLRCTMTGDDQPSLPAEAGKLSFAYTCK
jgi:hypothetical protein